MKKETRLGRGGRGWRIHHGFIHQFLDLMFLESVHELSGLARSAELVGLFCFVYMYLADRQYSRSRNGTDYQPQVYRIRTCFSTFDQNAPSR
jgi:hypothetical protein